MPQALHSAPPPLPPPPTPRSGRSHTENKWARWGSRNFIYKTGVGSGMGCQRNEKRTPRCLLGQGLGWASHFKDYLLHIVFMGKPPGVSKPWTFHGKVWPCQPSVKCELLAVMILDGVFVAVDHSSFSFRNLSFRPWWRIPGTLQGVPKPPSVSLAPQPPSLEVTRYNPVLYW